MRLIRSILLGFLGLSTGFSVDAHAVTGPGTISIRWNDCSFAGASNRSSSCDTNEGEHRLYVHFDPGETLPRFRALVARIDLLMPQFQDPYELPDYWKHGPDGCRVGPIPTNEPNLTLETDRPASCAQDPWKGMASGQYLLQSPSPDVGLARWFFYCEIPEPIEIMTEVGEWYAFDVRITNSRTLSEGSHSACAGCELPLCFELRWIQLIQTPDQGYDPYAETPGGFTNFLTWQAGPYTSCYGLPAHSTTWGRVKKLYR